jgi:hypothetical protein
MQESNVVLHVVVCVNHIEGAAESADTFCILKILKVMMQVRIQLYQNTHKGLEIQYRCIYVVFLENDASPVTFFPSSTIAH